MLNEHHLALGAAEVALASEELASEIRALKAYRLHAKVSPIEGQSVKVRAPARRSTRERGEA